MSKLSFKTFVKKSFPTVFAKTYFYGFWKVVYNFCLKGMGIGNGITLYTSGEKAVIKHIFKKYNIKIVFDVGANLGNYSKSIKENFPDTLIYAFEPHPKTYNTLKEVSAGYDKFYTYNVAVGNPLNGHAETIKLYDYSNNDGSDHASVLEDTFLYSHNTNDVISHEVELKSLKEFCLTNHITGIDFLKIDTEGFELDVLKGLKEMLGNNSVKFIQFEFNAMNAGRVFFLDFWKMLSENFFLYRLFPNGLYKIESYDPQFLEIFHFQNYIAINKTAQIQN